MPTAKSAAKLKCGAIEAPAFFTAFDRITTHSAAVTCNEPEVKLSDGRTLLAKLQSRFREVDIAHFQVSVGEGEPLRLGDSRPLKEGSEVTTLSGIPGRVQELFVTRFGVAHFTVAFQLPVEPGSPVLDEHGTLVGVASDSKRVLPVESLEPPQRGVKNQYDLFAGIAREIMEMRTALKSTLVAAVLLDSTGVTHAVLVSPNPEEAVVFDECGTQTPVYWEAFRKEAWHVDETRDLFHFIDGHQLGRGLWMSTLTLPCKADGHVRLAGAPSVFTEGWVKRTMLPVSDTEPAGRQVWRANDIKNAFGPQRVASGGTLAPTSNVDAKRASDTAAAERKKEERYWRGRFTALRNEIDKFEMDLRQKQRFIESSDRNARRGVRLATGHTDGLNPADRELYDAYKKDVAEADRDRQKLQERMDDLEREASSAAVPREWRR